MKSCLLFPGALAVCFGIGRGVIEILLACEVAEPLAGAIGTAVWLYSFLILIAYAPLWMDRERVSSQINLRAMTHQERRAESKLQSAEFRMGGVFGLLAVASIANGSDVVVWITAISCAVIGGCLGFDIKRRVRRLREQFAREQSARLPSMPSVENSIVYHDDFPV